MIERKTNGIVIGVVTNLEDEDNIGRVKVRFPNLENEESDWARLVSPMAGKNRGAFFRPEVEDEVLVAFENGEPRRPYILGSLWSKADTPPPDDGDAKKNNWRFIQSRSGHIILLDDTEGAERILIVDKDNSRRVLIDSGNKRIQVSCDDGAIDIKASNDVTIEGMNISVKAKGTMNLEAAGDLTIKGATVNIN